MIDWMKIEEAKEIAYDVIGWFESGSGAVTMDKVEPLARAVLALSERPLFGDDFEGQLRGVREELKHQRNVADHLRGQLRDAKLAVQGITEENTPHYRLVVAKYRDAKERIRQLDKELAVAKEALGRARVQRQIDRPVTRAHDGQPFTPIDIGTIGGCWGKAGIRCCADCEAEGKRCDLVYPWSGEPPSIDGEPMTAIKDVPTAKSKRTIYCEGDYED